MPALDAVSTSDGYSAAATLQNVWGSSGGYYSVQNADVYMQLQYGPQGTDLWNSFESHINAGAYGILLPGTVGIRFRSYTAGSPAKVSGALSLPVEPPVNINTFGVSSSAVSTFLGVFTVAQWPPTNPVEGNLAILADTYGGVTFAWPLSYQPSVLGATYPWGPPSGMSSEYAYRSLGNLGGTITSTTSGWRYQNGGNSGSFPATLDLTIPRPGNWSLAASASIETLGAAKTVGVGLSSTSTVQPVAGNSTQILQAGAANVGANASMSGGVLSGLAAAATVYLWLYQSDTTAQYCYGLRAGYYPIAIA